MISESELEKLTLTWFQDVGWDFLHGPDIAPDGETPERIDYRQVLLPGRVLDALQRLNPQVPEAILGEVLHRLAKPDQLSLLQNNRAFHEALLDGVPVEYDRGGEKRGDRVRMIDFAHPERNRFLVVNQFPVQGTRYTRRPDIVIFINGLPVEVIELKNLVDEQTDIWTAFNQFQTDRNDLDGQLYQTFVNAKSLLRESPQQAEDRDQLRELHAGRPSGGIIFTTIQKFMPSRGEARYPQLSDRTNIVVIADEARRSQYGFRAVLERETGAFKYGYAQHLRDALPRATFVGFTGTPLETDDQDTRAVFGEYVSIYDIQDAVDDGATVPIYYESRLAKLDINQVEIEQLNQEVDEVFEDEEDAVLREQAKSRWATLEKLVGAEPRVVQVAEDIVTHFKARNDAVEGKGMIVCMSRAICVHMYNAIVRLRPQWHSENPMEGAIKVIMSGSASDTELLWPHIYNASTKKQLEKRFKDPAGPLRGCLTTGVAAWWSKLLPEPNRSRITALAL